MRVVAYRTSNPNNTVVLEESTGESVVSRNILDHFFFLVEEFEDKAQDCMKVCWNVDGTVSLFLRLLGVPHCQKLRDTNRCHVAPFNVFYVPDKVFSVTHIPTRAKANLYGIQQYFVELGEPEHLMEVRLLTEKLLEELRKMGMTPTKLTSPVAIYEECVMQTLDLPKLKDIPVEATEFAYRAACRLWIESTQCGYWA